MHEAYESGLAPKEAPSYIPIESSTKGYSCSSSLVLTVLNKALTCAIGLAALHSVSSHMQPGDLGMSDNLRRQPCRPAQHLQQTSTICAGWLAAPYSMIASASSSSQVQHGAVKESIAAGAQQASACCRSTLQAKHYVQVREKICWTAGSA